MSPPVGWWFIGEGGNLRQIRDSSNTEALEADLVRNLTTLRFQEKLLRESMINPYRKPTQVDGERILRRLG